MSYEKFQQEDLVKAINTLRDKLLEIENEPKDTSNDGVSILETDEGSCVQIMSNGITTLMSFDMYEQLINTDLEKVK